MQIEIKKRIKVDLPGCEYAEAGDRFRGCEIVDGKARISGGHGIYAHVEPGAYVVIKERRVEYSVDPVPWKESDI